MSERRIDTEHGEARLVTAPARSAVATLLLSHGAGNGIDTPDLEALAEHLPQHGVTVVRLEQPWRVRGGRVATPPPTLDTGLRAAVAALADGADGADGGPTPLVLGGRSAGARSAARTAYDVGARGCLALAFPLHPPGRPERSRLQELLGARVPTLVVQGERDPMGRPEEFPEALPDGIGLCVLPGADHGLRVGRRSPVSQEDVLGILVESVLVWMVRDVVGSGADAAGGNAGPP